VWSGIAGEITPTASDERWRGDSLDQTLGRML
jgi:hypothetical protein